MMFRMVFFVWMVLSVISSRGAWAESIWNTATEMSTCRGYHELTNFLHKSNYVCRSDAPPLHRDWVGQEWLTAAGLSACYIGQSNHIPGIQSGYRCSVTTDRKQYHHIICTQSYSSNEIEHAKSSAENWEANLFARATELKKCEGGSIDMSFANRTLVPEALWKWYRHELGIVLSRQDSLMYMGIGVSSSCGNPRKDGKGSIGVISFLLGAGGPTQPNPVFWETSKNLGGGIVVTIVGMRDLEEVKELYNPSGSWGEFPPGLSVTMGSVTVSASPMLQRDNLKTLRSFRDVDFAAIFSGAWFDIEEELHLEYTGENFSDYVEDETESLLGLEHLRCQFGGIVGFNKFLTSLLTEAEIFVGRGVTGCRFGEVFLVTMPLNRSSSSEADATFMLIGRQCENIFRTQGTILRRLEETVSNSVEITEILGRAR